MRVSVEATPGEVREKLPQLARDLLRNDDCDEDAVDRVFAALVKALGWPDDDCDAGGDDLVKAQRAPAAEGEGDAAAEMPHPEMRRLYRGAQAAGRARLARARRRVVEALAKMDG